MASKEFLEKAYLAYFGRPVDPVGLYAFQNSSEAEVYEAFFASPESQRLYGTDFGAAQINAIYNMLFGRDAEPAGMAYWLNQLELGLMTPAGAAITILDGALNQDKVKIANKLAASSAFTASLDTLSEAAAYVGDAAAQHAREFLKSVGTLPKTQAQIDAAIDALVEMAEPGVIGKPNLYTLTDIVNVTDDVLVDIVPVAKYITYIGFNPHAHGETGVDNLDGNNPDGNDNNLTNEGPFDGGVPLYDLNAKLEPATGSDVVVQKGLFSYIKDLVGLDFVQLGLINVGDATGTLLAGLAGAITIGNQTGDNNNVTVSVTAADGTVHTAEVDINNSYFKLLTNLVFDEESNLRLYEVEVLVYPQVPVLVGEDASGKPIYADQPVYKYVSEEGTTTVVPIVLTNYNNNGGTVEKGLNGQPYVTTTANDLIVAGRLELLHQAYIDAGAGVNTLEVDAKGYYAQPLALTNIQHIKIHNLPNVYNGASGSTYPDLASSIAQQNSVLDLTRAIDIETLTITESNFEGLASGLTTPGSLTVSGIRNGAETTLDGSFSQNVYLHFGELQGNGVDLVLNNVNFGSQGGTSGNQLFIGHNSNTLNIESTGGGNFIANANLVGTTGGLSILNISGDAHLFIEGDLDPSFHNAHPAVINAAANTGGVNLTLSGSQNVTITGSQGNDRFDITTADREGSPTNDETVTIYGGIGDNYYEVSGAEIVTITNGDGNNNYEIDNVSGQSGFSLSAVNKVTITTGNGNNHFEIDNVATAILTAGNGNNNFDITSSNSADYSDPEDSFDFTSNITIVAGNGKNDIDVDANANIGVVNVTVGNGGNAVNVEAATISVTAGTGADDIRVEGRDITVTAGGSNNSITVVGIDNDYTNNVGGNTNNAGAPYASSSAGAKIVINAGSNSTVILGSGEDPQSVANDDFPGVGNLVAKEGSSISGTNVKLVVDTIVDLRAADLSGITRIVLDDDASSYAASGKANDVIGSGDLPTVAVSRAVLTLTATQLLEIGADAFSVDGAVFNTHAYVRVIVDQTTSLTALGVSGLAKNIDLLLEVQDGVTLTMTAEQLHRYVAPQGVTLASDGNTDLAAGKVVITGGGLNFDPFNTGDFVKTNINGTKYYGGSLSSDFGSVDAWYNVSVKSLVNGYDRPADVAAEVVITLDSGIGAGTFTQGAFATWHTNLEIIGEKDINFTGAVQLGMKSGVPTNAFTIDFSELEADVNGFTVDNFEMLANGGGIYGNADAGYNAEVWINLAKDTASDGIGFDETNAKSLVSKGVSKYVVTVIDGPTAAVSTGSIATLKLCDTTQDLETLALRGNYNDTLKVVDAAWGLVFELQGGSTAKADGPTGTANVGILDASFEWEGADAVVNLVHSVTADTRPVFAKGITINNADSITVNAGSASAVIGSIGGDDVSELNFSSSANVTIQTALSLPGLSSIDGSDVDGAFTLSLSGTADGAGFDFVGAAGTTTLTLNGVSAGTHSSFSAADAATFNLVATGTNDLSKATLTNVDALSLGAIGGTASSVTLSAAQALDIGLASITLTHPGLDGTLNLVNLGAAAFNAGNLGAGVKLGSVTIAAGNITLDAATVLTDADVTVAAGSTLTLTADQFMALDDLDGVAAGAIINITGLTQAHIAAGFTLANVSNATGTVSLAGNVNLATTTSLNGFGVALADGQTLGLATAAQASGLKVEGGADSTIKLLFNTMTGSINASGFNVDNLLFPDLLVIDENVDAIFTGLLPRVEKVLYNDAVSLVDQTVTISAGTFVRGGLSFDRLEDDLELEDFTINLQGGTYVDGSIGLGVAAKDGDLIQTYLKTLTINSTGTVANPQTGETDNIITGSIAAGTGATENQLLDVTINAAQDLVVQGSLVFTAVVNSDEAATLEVNGAGNVTIAQLNTQDDDVDALNVINNGTGTLSVGISAANIDATDVLSFTGTGDIALTVAGTFDLRNDDLSAVSQLNLAQGASVTLTMAQAELIGAGNIVLASGATAATLNLAGLDGEPFAIANYGPGVSVGLLTLAADPVVTLNAATNLTGIGGLVVPEGTVLNLTAAQFQQLTAGTITGVKANGAATSNFTVNITGLTQADVDAGFDLSGITAANLTVTLAGNVTLDSAETNDLNGADIAIGANTFTLYSVALADGLNITGTGVLKFTDLVPQLADQINASGFAVSELHMTSQLVDGQNVDLLFQGLAASVIKVITDDYGYVTGTSQTVVIQAGALVNGNLAFIKQEGGVEILNFTMNLQGGVLLDGNVNLSKDAPGNLIPQHLQKVTINSTGTAANVLNGETANVITGNITAAALVDVDPLTAGNQGTLENNLLNVEINASQDLVIEGLVVFNSVTSDDAVSANDNDEAVATLTVTGAADVTLGGVSTADDDVDGLNVVNNGTGTLSLTIDAANIDDNGGNNVDALSFTGTGDIALTVAGAVDLSDDVLTAVSAITIAQNATVTLTQGQFDALGAANLLDGGAVGNATLHLVDFGAAPFNATTIAAGINVASITMAAGNITLDPATDLTGVDMIYVPEGSTLTMTAAQFQQLQGSGTITGIEANGNVAGTPFTLNITGLTQADINLTGGFVLTGIDDDATINIDLAEDVNLAANTNLDDLTRLTIDLADNQTLGLANATQANGLNVDGGANTTIVFQYAPHTTYPGQIDASGYDVTTLKALAVGFTIGGNSNVEYSIDDLPSSVELRLYADSADLGFLDPTFRRVTIEEGITTPTGLIFNDWDNTDEVRTLTLTLEGDVTLNGNLSIPTRTNKDGTYGTTQYFDTLTIVSEGTEANTIAGNINTATVLGAPNTSDNNLLKVVINADTDLNIAGDIVFNSIDVPLDNAVANLTVTGAGDVSIQQLNILDDDIDVLNVANNGTGTLTVTGASPAIDGDASIETINLSGTGDIVFGVHPDISVVTEWGITAGGLSTLNAAGLSGDLTVGEVRDIDSANFTFTAGTGVTKLTLSADTLDVTQITDIGWNFNFTNAAAGSEFRLGSLTQNAPTFTDGPLSINLGANTTLYIDKNTDLSLIDLTLLQTLPIVLADGVTLTLTAEQADGLVIIAGPDTGAAGITAQVNIVKLGDAPVDLSGIAANIAGTATLEDNDVTLDAATDLGDFSVTLTSLNNTNLAGQTIRFQNVDQAAREVIVSDVAGPGTNSSNVVWLFDSVTGPVNTNGYDADLGRLWINQTLANGANVEDLFTTLPATIVRVEFSTIEFVNASLTSADVNRVVELVAHTDLPAGLVFSDGDRLEHLNTLTLQLGGEVNVGSLNLDNIVVPAANVGGISFDKLTINSYRALHQDHFLAPELYVNDNDGVNEAGEHVAPANLNVIGNIGIGANNGLDLLVVELNTGNVSAVGNTTNTDAQNLALSQGANLQIGTITFDSETAASTAVLTVTGANNTTIASLNTSDPQITGLTVTNSGTGVLTVTGASPAAAVSNTEVLTINATGDVVLGTAGDLDKPGIDGSQLSLVDVNGTGDVDLGLIVRIDGVAPVLPATYSFFLDATGNSGDVTAVLSAGTAGAPVLQAGGVWIFDNGNAPGAGTLSITLSDDVTLGAGTLNLNNLTLTIDGDVDFTTLATFIRDVTDVTIVVPATSSLTLTAAQANGLTIKGAGEVFVTALEATPAADLGNIMTNEGDSGTVFATVNTADDADPDLLPELVNLTGDLGIAQVTVTGDGVADVTSATMDATIDRDPTVVVDSEDVMATFIVQAGATLVVTAAQGDERSVTGAGTTNVEDIGLFATANDMSLAGIVTANVNIAVDTNTTLNRVDNLGAAGAGRVTTIATGVTLTAASSVITNQYIVGENATLLVDDENTLPVETPITANLSNVTVEFITLVANAEVGTITFPVLYGDPVAKYEGFPLALPLPIPADPTVAVQTVTMTAAQASNQTINGASAGAHGEVIVNALGAGFTNLSNIDVGKATAHVPADATLHAATDLGEFDVELATNVDLILSAAQADGIKITPNAAAAGTETVTVTALAATPNADLSAIAVDDETALLDANNGVTLGANLGTGFEVIVSDSVAGGPNVVTFTGSMNSAGTTFTIAAADITLVFDANNAHDLTVAEQAPGYANSAVVVNNVDGDEMDLAGITADSMIANVPADATMHAATDFGGFVVRLAEGADLTLSYTQFLNVAGNGALAAGDFDSAAGGVEELVTVTGWNPSAALDTSVVLPNLALVLQVDAALGAAQTVNAATNLTGVEEIVIPAGVTLTMTASQFQQIQTSATVTGAGTLNLTDFDQDNYLIDLSTVTANAGTISLDPTKGATNIVGGQVQWVDVANKIVLDPTAVLDNATGSKFSIIMTAANQGITLSSETQADGRSVSEGNQPAGYANTRLILGFDSPDATDGDSNLVATNFKVDNVIVLNTYLSNQFGGVTPANIETFLSDLDSGIPVTIFDADSALVANVVSPSAVAAVNRTVTVEPNTFVDASIAFNDIRPDSEVRTLVLNLNGNAIIDGNLTLPQNQDPRAQLPTSYVQLFDSLTINSTDAVGTLVSPNELRGNIIANTALNGAESQVEVFTLTLDAAMTIVGSEDQIGFDGRVINLGDGWNVDQVGAALATGYNNWRGTYDAVTNVVTFTNITAGATADVAIGAFTFVQNGASTNFPGTSAVAVTQQGSFAAGENNLLNVTIVATHDLNITGELEFSYVSGTSSILNTTVDETAEANLTITVDAGTTVNIGSVDTSDDHITALNYVKNGLGTVNAPGTSPGASVGDTETLRITQVDGGTTTFGTAGNLDRPGVAGDDLSLIDVNGLGTIDLGVIALVDAELFQLNTDGMGAASVVNATLRADMAAGGTWTFDNSAGLGDLNLTITGTGVADTYGVDPVYGAAFGAGGTLVFDNVNLLLEGAVDLSGVTLTLTNTTLSVLAGGTLTLTVQQVLALQAAGVNVTGEGTVAVIGDATDVNANDLGQPLRTVGVDLSGITLDTTPPAPVDADGQLDIVLLGALVDDGNALNGYNPVVAAGQNIIGSDNDDDITASGQNDTLTGGLGNDTLRGNGGDDTYNVDAGTDTIIGLNTGDVLVVSAGATTNPQVATGFVATAATINDGTVALTDTDNNGDTIINMSLAGGANGFTITGGTGAALGTDRLTGSANDDVINGGNTTQTNAAAKDILTGGLGADQFVFNLTLSSAATLTTVTTQAAIDREVLTFTADDTDDNAESITVNYSVNGIALVALIDLTGVDVTNLAAIVAEAIATLDARAGISATAGAGVGEVVITGDSGAAVTITGLTVQDGAAEDGGAEPVVDGLGVIGTNGLDVAQTTTITVTGTPTAGDYYSVLVDYFLGTGTSDDYTALGGDDALNVAEGLDDLSDETIVSAENSGTNVITLTAVNADAGGFSVVTDTTAAFAGSGASDNGAVDYLTADVITDFATAVDSISFGLAAGVNGVNYLEAAGVANYGLARTAADAAFDGTVQYYLTSATDFDGVGGTGQVEGQEGGGLLFFDANLDGNVDGVVILLGVTSATFHASDIVA